jgi:hypothetical protein
MLAYAYCVRLFMFAQTRNAYHVRARKSDNDTFQCACACAHVHLHVSNRAHLFIACVHMYTDMQTRMHTGRSRAALSHQHPENSQHANLQRMCVHVHGICARTFTVYVRACTLYVPCTEIHKTYSHTQVRTRSSATAASYHPTEASLERTASFATAVHVVRPDTSKLVKIKVRAVCTSLRCRLCCQCSWFVCINMCVCVCMHVYQILLTRSSD